jgi:hypothetical protein
MKMVTSDDSKDVFAAFDEVMEVFSDYQFTWFCWGTTKVLSLNRLFSRKVAKVQSFIST